MVDSGKCPQLAIVASNRFFLHNLRRFCVLHETIRECIAGGDEFDLASELAHRILDTSGYISYEALKRGSVSCSRRGASYYNYRPGGKAYPYSRGCSAITRCRS
ncbi:Rapid alkalinization factor [Platanthera guangdongensis]|uniref:Rapid alkalinization factor n=1 Tax=Platanthera guangdongensis TaxID=2320717 RepID=A0ABR2N141_9ASPA